MEVQISLEKMRRVLGDISLVIITLQIIRFILRSIKNGVKERIKKRRSLKKKRQREKRKRREYGD